MNQRWTIATVSAVALLAGGLMAGCGSDAKTATTAAPTSSPAATTSTVAGTAVPATSAAPEGTTAGTGVPDSAPITTATHIVSLSPTATEMLFAIGAGSQVIAVDDQSTYPADALQKPHDLSGFQPNVEAIAKLKPDLVTISDDSAGIAKQLDALGIDVWVGPAAASFDDVYAQIEQLGVSTGHVADAAALVLKMQTDIKTAVDSIPATSKALTYYHELDPTFYSVTSKTFIGSVYSLFNMVDIADQAPAGNDYPQLSSEFVVQQSPDFIFLADTKCCQQTPATVAARPGWGQIAAVKSNHVIALDDDIASRWGPRIVDYIQAVAKALATASVSSD
jgi:iron complex transport system substrate-binding protein